MKFRLDFIVLVVPLKTIVMDGYASSCGMRTRTVEAGDAVVVEVHVAVRV
ncbi:MAG TPA: hypothetical protein VLY21_02515 [Nitrososphaerales archaeon]|nr:hypothetical protein [Nitrososphaerales archaeon]